MNFRTIKCCICNSVLLNLPEEELKKLNNISLRCESCGQRLILDGNAVTKAVSAEPLQNIFKYDFNI